MKINFRFSEKLLREYIHNKVIVNRIMLIAGLLIFAVCAILNKQGAGLKELGNKNLTLSVIVIMFALVIAGGYGFIKGITAKRQTYNCQLELEDNTITFMRISDIPFIFGSVQVGMQGWHMDEVTDVEEHKTYYLIKGKGVHVPDTRIMSDQKQITQFKVPKWFEGMEALKKAVK